MQQNPIEVLIFFAYLDATTSYTTVVAVTTYVKDHGGLGFSAKYHPKTSLTFPSQQFGSIG